MSLMRLVQLVHRDHGRKVALVEEPNLRFITGITSIFSLATKAIAKNGNISAVILEHLSNQYLDYESVYEGLSEWKLLPSFDHPVNPMALLISGTGLTHKSSAMNRQKMHTAQLKNELTDSMKMYLDGLEGGQPKKGEIGVQPEWFYKGNGSVLRAHGQSLEIPNYANDGGEEPEIAGIYINDAQGKNWRIGFTIANEFSDHIMERKNYLYLAPSKIRNCSIGPELVINMEFIDISGKVTILRNNQPLWEKVIKTGVNNMAHNLDNLEHHHFKYANNCLPNQAHIHFFGADAFSFGDQVQLQADDLMEIAWKGMGRPLRNTLIINREKERVKRVYRFT